MSNLHAYFALKNEQAFSKLLEATKSRKQPSTPSSSLGKRTALLTQDLDVNAKDWLGRTVLHLACSTVEPYALTYIRMLLAYPTINVNVQDAESKWTPLHRALYSGNLSACQLLLKRLDIDTQIRDNEGLTSFELYNLTQEGPWPLKPSSLLSRQGPPRDLSLPADFFTWGGNRNATLGHGDSNDRAFPDHVIIPRAETLPGANKFSLVQAKVVSMAKLHTTVITDETGHNLRICGFGSGGRLGHTKHTLYNLQHGPQIPHCAISVVAVQDHTLILTNRGEVWSWGLNRFSQLGYVIESSAPGQGKSEEPIQAVPRRVLGPLKKEIVVGISASKIASACWTLNEGDAFTWGTNNGQLGYDSSSQPVRVLPRKVTGVQNVIDIAFTDSAMACLLHTGDVVCFRDDNRFRVIFSVSGPLGLTPYIPPSAGKPPAMIKVTGCEGTFAALSTKGDVWTFSAPSRLSTAAESGKDGKNKDRIIVKPQRIWTAKRLVDSARDVALGMNGDIIICTESGHVFTRSRTTASLSTPRSGSAVAITKGAFCRVPFIHRAIRVYANSAGGFGALRLNYSPRPVVIEGSTLGENIATMRSWASKEYELDNKTVQSIIEDNSERDGDQGPTSISKTSAKKFLELLFIDDKSRRETKQGLFTGKLEHGSNMICRAGMDIPVHRALLAARSPVLRAIFAHGRHDLRDGSILIEYTNCDGKPCTINTSSVLKISGVQPLTVLLLLEFFYTDTIPILDILPFNNAVQIRREFDQLATILAINDLFVTGDTDITVHALTLGQHLWAMFNACQNGEESSTNRAVRPDVFIVLLDRQIACHSIILRFRCLFFANFFEEDAWTMNRWTHDRTITINMQHMEWRGFYYVMKWIYSGEEEALFNNLDDIDTVQNFIDLLFEVISMASELLLDRLMTVCSSILLRFVTISNAPYLLSRATYYNALPLISSLHDYIACNLEAILESRLLDDNRERGYDVEDLIPALGRAIRARQAIFSPSTRAGLNMDELMKRNADWLELQDIPSPIVRSQRISSEQQSPRLTPTSSGIPLTTTKSNVEDYIFHMDENTAVSPLPSATSQTSAISVLAESARKVWKSKTMQDIPKVDFKAVMAETAAKTVLMATPGEKRLSVDQSGIQLSTRVPAMPPTTTTLPHISGAPPWNVSIQRPSTDAHSVSVSAFDSHQSLLPGSAKSPAKVEPGMPISTLSPSSSPNSTKHSSIIRRGPNDAPAWSSGLSSKDLSPPMAGLSFVAIQEQQLAQIQPVKEKPTLRQIQEEERARKEEEDFLKWWAAEEERVAKQSGTASGTNMVNTRNRHGKSRRKGLGKSNDTAAHN